MADEDLANNNNSIDVSQPEAQYQVQCAEIKLVSSSLRPLDPEKEKMGKSRFTFNIKVDIEYNVAFAQFQTQVVYVTSAEEKPLSGFWLRFILVGTFIADEKIQPEALGDFARLYTLSILWPYAREYTSDQFRRTGEPFDSLPIINPQVITENMIKSGMVKVKIHSNKETDPESNQEILDS